MGRCQMNEYLVYVDGKPVESKFPNKDDNDDFWLKLDDGLWHQIVRIRTTRREEDEFANRA